VGCHALYLRGQTKMGMKMASMRDAILVILFVSNSLTLLAQTDSLVFTNGKYAVGEIKKMERGVVILETDYSDSDFRIEWEKVEQVYSDQTFTIYLSDHALINSDLQFDVDDNRVVLVQDGEKRAVNIYDIVYFKSISETFRDRLSANIDVGLNLTKANNLRQFSSRMLLGYLARKWEVSASYNTVFSRQDSVPQTSRADANINVKRFMPHDFYLGLSNDFLSNDEQNLKLRSNLKAGVGKYLIRNNSLYWGLFGGIAYNNEVFTDEVTSSRKTAEAFVGTELNLFNAGDFSLSTNATVYPNLTAEGRIRSDIKLDLVYDLPLDFYVKIGSTINYDNQPASSGTKLDYVIQTGFGWKW